MSQSTYAVSMDLSATQNNNQQGSTNQSNNSQSSETTSNSLTASQTLAGFKKHVQRETKMCAKCNLTRMDSQDPCIACKSTELKNLDSTVFQSLKEASLRSQQLLAKIQSFDPSSSKKTLKDFEEELRDIKKNKVFVCKQCNARCHQCVPSSQQLSRNEQKYQTNLSRKTQSQQITKSQRYTSQKMRSREREILRELQYRQCGKCSEQLNRNDFPKKCRSCCQKSNQKQQAQEKPAQKQEESKVEFVQLTKSQSVYIGPLTRSQTLSGFKVHVQKENKQCAKCNLDRVDSKDPCKICKSTEIKDKEARKESETSVKSFDLIKKLSESGQLTEYFEKKESKKQQEEDDQYYKDEEDDYDYDQGDEEEDEASREHRQLRRREKKYDIRRDQYNVICEECNKKISQQELPEQCRSCINKEEIKQEFLKYKERSLQLKSQSLQLTKSQSINLTTSQTLGGFKPHKQLQTKKCAKCNWQMKDIEKSCQICKSTEFTGIAQLFGSTTLQQKTLSSTVDNRSQYLQSSQTLDGFKKHSSNYTKVCAQCNFDRKDSQEPCKICKSTEIKNLDQNKRQQELSEFSQRSQKLQEKINKIPKDVLDNSITLTSQSLSKPQASKCRKCQQKITRRDILKKCEQCLEKRSQVLNSVQQQSLESVSLSRQVSIPIGPLTQSQTLGGFKKHVQKETKQCSVCHLSRMDSKEPCKACKSTELKDFDRQFFKNQSEISQKSQELRQKLSESGKIEEHFEKLESQQLFCNDEGGYEYDSGVEGDVESQQVRQDSPYQFQDLDSCCDGCQKRILTPQVCRNCFEEEHKQGKQKQKQPLLSQEQSIMLTQQSQSINLQQKSQSVGSSSSWNQSQSQTLGGFKKHVSRETKMCSKCHLERLDNKEPCKACKSTEIKDKVEDFLKLNSKDSMRSFELIEKLRKSGQLDNISSNKNKKLDEQKKRLRDYYHFHRCQDCRNNIRKRDYPRRCDPCTTTHKNIKSQKLISRSISLSQTTSQTLEGFKKHSSTESKKCTQCNWTMKESQKSCQICKSQTFVGIQQLFQSTEIKQQESIKLEQPQGLTQQKSILIGPLTESQTLAGFKKHVQKETKMCSKCNFQRQDSTEQCKVCKSTEIKDFDAELVKKWKDSASQSQQLIEKVQKSIQIKKESRTLSQDEYQSDSDAESRHHRKYMRHPVEEEEEHQRRGDEKWQLTERPQIKCEDCAKTFSEQQVPRKCRQCTKNPRKAGQNKEELQRKRRDQEKKYLLEQPLVKYEIESGKRCAGCGNRCYYCYGIEEEEEEYSDEELVREEDEEEEEKQYLLKGQDQSLERSQRVDKCLKCLNKLTPQQVLTGSCGICSCSLADSLTITQSDINRLLNYK